LFLPRSAFQQADAFGAQLAKYGYERADNVWMLGPESLFADD